MPAILPASLYVGQNVDIQRSDGRVHSAVVSEIIEDSSSVKVEWFEHNETKGKEIEFDIIFRLNPQLADDVKSEPKSVARETNNVQSRVQRPKSTVEDVPKQSRLPSSRDARKSYAPRPVSSHNRRETIAPSHKDDVPQTVKKENVAPPAAKRANPRRSNVVKEIEKIKEDRDKRRAAAQAKSHNVVDKSNPNWQFIDMIEEYRETIEYIPLKHDDKIEEHQICVCVRKRPLNRKELNRKDVDVVTIPNKQNIVVHEPRHKVDLTKYLENQKFRFDYAFDDDANNEMVYRYTAQPLVHSIFQRGMATCFAYGQTGSGKTHTMGGEFVSKGQQLCENGIYALSARDMFKLLNSKYKHDDLIASVSFFEIYSGKVFDLLNNKIKLRILEDGKAQVQVVGLKEEVVTNADQVLKLLSHGTQVRTSGTTSANQHSSRSHAIFQLILRKNTRGRPLHGKFSLIDLAGNERGADTSSADRQTRMEGAEINKSLLALKECIRALGRKGAHLPFRASKLTLVLRDSFVGDKAKTCMISTISPGNQCCEHTLNTLRYADRVKELGADAPPSGAKVFDESVFSQHAMSPQNSDLALLRTQNAEEVSDDLLNFHEVINHMQDLEDEIIDEFKDYVQHSERFLKEDNKLIAAAERVDYDVDSFTRQLGANLDKRIHALQSLRNKVSSFREDLDNEESISKKFNKKK